ncbi:dTDP-4-dehydrorhamnose reductase [Moritella sp. 28]|uniref:dTDP-4-dehydrorhamnose reductase n=1 Tax=Moritella sp. 28 TaxID=2746232 RepID=UPI001BAB8C6F|nr:dTDP-4-dehydrorhamnose reductase [Moritella sp. 28]QUM83553.1 dTDP-4-dehydrorhamnose reductase [Moritella sp. 28]
MNIVITGGGGQLSREIYNHTDGKHNYHFLNKEKLNVTSVLSINKILEGLKPDIIINTAAYTSVDKAESEYDSAYLVNSIGAKNIAKYCSDNDVVLIHISTDYVYSGEMIGFYKETESLNPKTAYGKTKLQAERYIESECDKYIIIRTSWLFSEYDNNFLKTIYKLSHSKDKICVVSDQLGAPTSCYSLSIFIIHLINNINMINENGSWGTYNYSDYPDASWYEFAQEIVNNINEIKNTNVKVIPILSEDYKTVAKRPQNSRLDCQKLINTFSFEMFNWKDQVKEVIKRIIEK